MLLRKIFPIVREDEKAIFNTDGSLRRPGIIRVLKKLG